MTESDYIFRWSLTIGAGFFLVLCGFLIDFFLTRSRKHKR